MEDRDLLREIRAQAAQVRRHAPFFSWHDRSAKGKGVAEVGIVRFLLEAMKEAGGTDYVDAKASNEVWPDVWLSGAAGDAIPCEVSELVDAQSMPAGTARPWTPKQLREGLQAIITKKDRRTLRGRGDKACVLVIHTDELYLDADSVAGALAGVVFKLSTESIGRAFLLLSYDPTRGGYRYFELPLAA